MPHTKRKFGVYRAEGDPPAGGGLGAMLLAKLMGGGGGEGSEIPGLPTEEGKVVREGNHLYFYAEVCKETCLKFARILHDAATDAQVDFLTMDLSAPPMLYLHISSLGGDLDQGFLIADKIAEYQDEEARVPVAFTSICEGEVASAATLISTAAKHRKIQKNATMLIHQLRGGFWGQHEEIEDFAKNTKAAEKRIVDHYLANTNYEEEELVEILGREIELDAEECVRKGLVDEIICPSERPRKRARRTRSKKA